MIIIGVLLNTLTFGLMGATNKQSGIPHLLPKILLNPIVDAVLLVLYILSFAIILLSPINIFFRIAIAILLQFVFNHFLWGFVIGAIGGVSFRKKTKV